MEFPEQSVLHCFGTETFYIVTRECICIAPFLISARRFSLDNSNDFARDTVRLSKHLCLLRCCRNAISKLKHNGISPESTNVHYFEQLNYKKM